MEDYIKSISLIQLLLLPFLINGPRAVTKERFDSFMGQKDHSIDAVPTGSAIVPQEKFLFQYGMSISSKISCMLADTDSSMQQ